MRLVLAILLLAVGAGTAWQVQDWRYGKQLADQSRAYGEEREASAAAVIKWQGEEQDRRRALEDRLVAQDQTHYKELTDEQKKQARLRDRLATADVRLSVLLNAAPSGGVGLPADASTCSVVHGGARAELDPAHAQRIVAITGDGDQGLIALRACQAYAKEVSATK
nr:lysis system i-spanin subunit Rz [Pseudomonas sp. Fl4BN1]